MNSRTKFVVVMSSTCLVALLLLGGVVSKGAPAEDRASADTNVYKHLAVYSEVLSRIKSEYVEEPDMSSVTLGAMNGLLESIDPYASYLNAEQYKDYLKNFDSYRGDLGMVLAKKFGYITIVSVIPGSPAAKAGMTTGDMLESIKGIATRDMPLAYARLLLRGEPGTTVDLSVLRRKPEPQKLTMTRAVVTLPAVESKMLPDNIGYIKVAAMGRPQIKQVSTALADLQKQGAKKLLLDLRYSASGDPEDGIELANLFLDKGLIAYSMGQKSPRKNYAADPGKDVTSLPLIVMTNRGTAAAAEVAAAALQGDKRAQIVGEHTYGDASVLRPITMEDGSAIILSVAKYYSPDGKSIQDNGVTPQELVAEAEIGGTTDADSDDSGDSEPLPKITGSDKKAGQAVSGGSDAKATEDLILQKAIELAKKA
ncbi:MAG: S41 family peptidase [Acidobacteriota bacterium]|nr:S41 family peptidase [Acidobacteriota bacterium]